MAISDKMSGFNLKVPSEDEYHSSLLRWYREKMRVNLGADARDESYSKEKTSATTQAASQAATIQISPAAVQAAIDIQTPQAAVQAAAVQTPQAAAQAAAVQIPPAAVQATPDIQTPPAAVQAAIDAQIPPAAIDIQTPQAAVPAAIDIQTPQAAVQAAAVQIPPAASQATVNESGFRITGRVETVDLTDMHLSQSPVPKARKRRLCIKDPDTQTILIRLCINHFAIFVKGPQYRYWNHIRMLFEKITGLDVSVQGVMKGWMEDRRKQVVADKKKSGIARSDSDRDQSLNALLLLFDDYKEKQNNKKKSEESLQKEKNSSEVLRENMCNTLSKKRSPESSSDSNTETENLDHDNTSNTNSTNGTCSHQSGSNKRPRSMPVKGTQKAVEMILAANEHGDAKMMETWSKVENQKMDRFENVAMKMVSGSGDPKLKERVDGLSEDVGKVKDDIGELKNGVQEMLQLLRNSKNVE